MHLKSFSDMRYATTNEISEVIRRFGTPSEVKTRDVLEIIKGFKPKPKKVEHPEGGFYYRIDSEKLLEFVIKNYPAYSGRLKLENWTVAQFYNNMIEWQVKFDEK